MVSILSSIFSFIGGIGIFLYGMHTMSESMQKVAGSKLNNVVNFLTKNKLMGIIVGALITVILNSSTAATVMVVGFVNAGLMNLSQAVLVIMGANVGTTITAWLVSLSLFGSDTQFLSFKYIAMLIVGLAALIRVFSKKEKIKNKSLIFIGFGLIFIGLNFMSDGIKPYTNSKIFYDAFVIFGKNPILSIIVGAIVTFMLQSSAVSVSILQTLAFNGSVSRGAAFFITMGQNIGTCISTIISSINGNKNGKRTALLHLLFNLFGTIVISLIFFVFNPFFSEFLANKIEGVEISMFHTGFNTLTTFILFPMSHYLVSVTKKIIPDEEDDEQSLSLSEKTSSILDKRLLEQPAVALATAKQEVVYFATYTRKNLERSVFAAINERDDELVDKIFKNENEIDKTNRILTAYLVKINNLPLTNFQHFQVEHMLSICSDVERIGDHCENIAKNLNILLEQEGKFSNFAIEELKEMAAETIDCINKAIDCFDKNDYSLIDIVRNKEQVLDDLQKKFRMVHIKRLSSGVCSTVAGICFLDIIGNLERMSDHAKNIVDYMQLEQNSVYKNEK